MRHGDDLQGLGNPVAFLWEDRIHVGERALRRWALQQGPSRGSSGEGGSLWAAAYRL